MAKHGQIFCVYHFGLINFLLMNGLCRASSCCHMCPVHGCEPPLKISFYAEHNLCWRGVRGSFGSFCNIHPSTASFVEHVVTTSRVNIRWSHCSICFGFMSSENGSGKKILLIRLLVVTIEANCTSTVVKRKSKINKKQTKKT